MTEGELEELADDLRANGLLDPITTYQGLILDGRNRFLACERAGVEPRFEEWDGESPLRYVLSHNVHRRHLTPGQRAAIAVEALPMFEAEARERQRTLNNKRKPLVANAPQAAPKSREDAAALTGASPRYVQEAKAVKEASPELFDEVKTGKTTLRSASKTLGRTPSGKSGKAHREYGRKDLKDVLDPLDKYLRTWDEERLWGTTPAQARRMLERVQRVNRKLTEVAIALEQRTVVSRALR
jgi:hypothetical protein